MRTHAHIHKLTSVCTCTHTRKHTTAQAHGCTHRACKYVGGRERAHASCNCHIYPPDLCPHLYYFLTHVSLARAKISALNARVARAVLALAPWTALLTTYRRSLSQAPRGSATTCTTCTAAACPTRCRHRPPPRRSSRCSGGVPSQGLRACTRTASPCSSRCRECQGWRRQRRQWKCP
jgi:hypothetical protein